MAVGGTQPGYASSTAIPILLNGRVLGALTIYAEEPGAFDRAELQLLTDLSDDLAYGIQALRTRAERERVEAALRESEQRYRDFIEHTSEGVWRLKLEQPIPIDPPGDDIVARTMQYAYMAECNLAYARTLGFQTPQEVVGKRHGELFLPSD